MIADGLMLGSLRGGEVGKGHLEMKEARHGAKDGCKADLVWENGLGRVE